MKFRAILFGAEQFFCDQIQIDAELEKKKWQDYFFCFVNLFSKKSFQKKYWYKIDTDVKLKMQQRQIFRQLFEINLEIIISQIMKINFLNLV